MANRSFAVAQIGGAIATAGTLSAASPFVSLLVGLNAVDNGIAGVRTLYSGESTMTFTAWGTSLGLQQLGISRGMADLSGEIANLTVGIGGGGYLGFTQAMRTARVTRIGQLRQILGGLREANLGRALRRSIASDIYVMRNVRTLWFGGKSPVRPNPLMPKGVEYMELSHTYIPNSQWGKLIPNWIKNQAWNLRAMWGSEHALVDPSRFRFMPRIWKEQFPGNGIPGNALTRLWGRMPVGHRIGVTATAGAGAAGAGYVFYHGSQEE